MVLSNSQYIFFCTTVLFDVPSYVCFLIKPLFFIYLEIQHPKCKIVFQFFLYFERNAFRVDLTSSQFHSYGNSFILLISLSISLSETSKFNSKPCWISSYITRIPYHINGLCHQIISNDSSLSEMVDNCLDV